MLAVTLTNINPVAHAAMALCNIARIGHAEAWAQYHYLTPAVARLVVAMDRERTEVAAAFGHTLTAIEAHFQRSFDVPQTTLAEIAAELHRRRDRHRSTPRFVLEDVPYGLVFNAALARIVGVEVPVTESTITLLSTVYAHDFSEANPVLASLRLTGTTSAQLVARCTG